MHLEEASDLMGERRHGHSCETRDEMTCSPRNVAFCALGTPVGFGQFCFSNGSSAIDSRSRAFRPVRRKVKAPGLCTTMSLTNDLIIKGLEFAAATFVGNTFAAQQAKKKPDNMFFRLGKKKGKQTKDTKVSKENVDNVVSEVLKVADQIPEFIEKGGPEGKKWVKLAICIIIDLIGSGSLGIPIVGDMLDLVTAPVSSAMLQALFGNTFITMAGFAEEILPGTDAIPTATLAWFAENYGYLKSNKEESSSS